MWRAVSSMLGAAGFAASQSVWSWWGDVPAELRPACCVVFTAVASAVAVIVTALGYALAGRIRGAVPLKGDTQQVGGTTNALSVPGQGGQ